MDSIPPLRHVKTLIFDLDGTLVDSLDDLVGAINLTRREYGQPALPRESIVCLIGYGSEYLVSHTLDLPANSMADAHSCYLRHYNEHMLDNTRLHEGVMDVLLRYRERQLAVVTNKNEKETRRLLAGLGLAEQFMAVIGGDSLPQKKPHPMQIQEVLRLAGSTQAESVMIGDSINDIRAGRAARVHTVGVTYGVDSADVLREENPDHMIDHMAELAELIG